MLSIEGQGLQKSNTSCIEILDSVTVTMLAIVIKCDHQSNTLQINATVEFSQLAHMRYWPKMGEQLGPKGQNVPTAAPGSSNGTV